MTGLGDGARHAPDNAGGFVLHDHTAAGGDDAARAIAAIMAHAGQHHGKQAVAEDGCGTVEERVGSRAAEVDLLRLV